MYSLSSVLSESWRAVHACKAFGSFNISWLLLDDIDCPVRAFCERESWLPFGPAFPTRPNDVENVCAVFAAGDPDFHG